MVYATTERYFLYFKSTKQNTKSTKYKLKTDVMNKKTTQVSSLTVIVI